MAETNKKVMSMVRRELKKNRAAATADLYEKAKKIDASVGDLTIRQFHAKYPLQVKRGRKTGGTAKRARKTRTSAKRAPARRRTAKRSRAATKKRGGRPRKRAGRPRKRAPRASAVTAPARADNGGRDDVRRLLLQFAKEIAAADGKADMIDVLTGVDGWVDRVVAAATG